MSIDKIEDPKHIEVNIGNGCNMKCLFCMSRNSKIAKRGNKKDVINMIINFRKKGYNSIGFIGGEPTIFPELKEYIKLAKYVGYRFIQITTNGYRLADINYFETLVESGLNLVKLSLHGVDDFSEKEISGGIKDVYSKKMQCIDNREKLKEKYSLLIDLQIVVNKFNYKNIHIIAKDLINKVKSIKFQFIGFYGHYEDEALEKSFITYEMVIPYLQKLVKFMQTNEKAQRMIKIGDFPVCLLLKSGVINSVNENIIGENYDYIDEVSDARNNRDFSFKERKLNFLKYYPLDDCVDCKYKNYNPCPGFYKKYFYYKDKFGLQEEDDIYGFDK